MATAVLVETDRLDDALAGRAPSPGLLTLNGIPAIQRALAALRACGDVDRIVLAGPDSYLSYPRVMCQIDDFVSYSAEQPEALAGLLAARDSEELLFWPPNGGLLTTAMVETFLRLAPADAAVSLAAVKRRCLVAAHALPVATKAWTFSDVTIAVSPLCVSRAGRSDRQNELLVALLAGRALSAEMRRILGVSLALRITAGAASLDEVLRRTGEHIGGPVVVALLPYAELAVRLRRRPELTWSRDRLECAAA